MQINTSKSIVLCLLWRILTSISAWVGSFVKWNVSCIFVWCYVRCNRLCILLMCVEYGGCGMIFRCAAFVIALAGDMSSDG